MEDIGSDIITYRIVLMRKGDPIRINVHCRHFMSQAALKQAGDHLSLTASDIETR